MYEEMEIAGPNSKEKMQMRQYQAQAAPLAQQEKGMASQMGDKIKQKAMNTAVDEGTKMAMNSFAPSAGAAKAAALAANPATMGMGGAEVALAGQAMGGAGAGAGLAGAGGMAALGTAIPYVGAGLLAGKALGLFNEGGMVGPLSPQYNAQGTMSEEQARALMMNQPEPIQTMPPTQAMPMMRPNPDELYNEIMAESMTEAAQQAMPMMRPPLGADPLNADRTYSPYDMIRPDNAPNT